MAEPKPKRRLMLGLGSALLAVAAVALVLAVFARERKIAALEAQIRQMGQRQVESMNAIMQLNQAIQQRIGGIEKRVRTLEPSTPAAADGAKVQGKP